MKHARLVYLLEAGARCTLGGSVESINESRRSFGGGVVVVVVLTLKMRRILEPLSFAKLRISPPRLAPGTGTLISQEREGKQLSWRFVEVVP